MTKRQAYGYGTEVRLSFGETQAKLIELLAAEGFGVLCTIDVQAKLKEKLGADMDEYVILGACNPPIAAEALAVEKEIGLLLPCNVIVYRKNGHTFVSAILPAGMMQLIGNPALDPIAERVEAKLKAVIDRIAAVSAAKRWVNPTKGHKGA